MSLLSFLMLLDSLRCAWIPESHGTSCLFLQRHDQSSCSLPLLESVGGSKHLPLCHRFPFPHICYYNCASFSALKLCELMLPATICRKNCWPSRKEFISGACASHPSTPSKGAVLQLSQDQGHQQRSTRDGAVCEPGGGLSA